MVAAHKLQSYRGLPKRECFSSVSRRDRVIMDYLLSRDWPTDGPRTDTPWVTAGVCVWLVRLFLCCSPLKVTQRQPGAGGDPAHALQRGLLSLTIASLSWTGYKIKYQYNVHVVRHHACNRASSRHNSWNLSSPIKFGCKALHCLMNCEFDFIAIWQ